jgi:glucose/arabinose dehydrogenase
MPPSGTLPAMLKGLSPMMLSPLTSTKTWFRSLFQSLHAARRMSLLSALLGIFAFATTAPAIEVFAPPLGQGLKNPESVVVAPDGRILVSVIGEFDEDGDGSVAIVVAGKEPQPWVTGLDDPKGIAFWKDWLFVADKKRVVRIDKNGKVEVFAAETEFPRTPKFLNDIAVDEVGNVYVSDSGDLQGHDGAVFRISTDRKITTLLDGQKNTAIRAPNGLMIDGPDHLLMADFLSGELFRVTIADGKMEKLAEGLAGADGLVRDLDGNLYISQWLTGRLSVMTPGSKQPVLMSDKFQAAADLGLNLKTGHVLVPDMKAGTVTAIPFPSGVPADVDQSPLESVKIVPAFDKLQFERPIVLTHAGDGTNRVFVASQLGRVYVFPNDEEASEAKLFFDLKEKVSYKDSENEEGFLGMAFHPRFKENGEFFVYYTTTDTPHVSVISRFRTADADKTVARRATEQEILRIPQPFWNHNGGTLAFGPDGYLYIGLGDGGAANDPYKNGQKMSTILGKILRIDVDRKDAGKEYAIPVDNPFVKQADAAPEIYASGVRNIWRMSFDRQTGALWAADVGQDIWEEINVVVAGGNYGWNLREGMHRFQAAGSGPRKDLLEPIWEYHHDVGKSVTGGHVYRGQKVPELIGSYLYADYVTGKVWALKYDESKRQAVANRAIAGNINPVMSFGEDEKGEVYFMTTQGKLSRFAPK